MSTHALERFFPESPVKSRKGLTTKTPESKDTYFGTVNLGHEPSKIVFLFPREDELFSQLEKKCKELNFSSVRVKTVDECLNQKASHEVVVVDARQKESLNPETIVRNFSSTLTDVVTTIAIVSSLSGPLISRLIGVGYSRVILEAEAQVRLPIELQLLENNEARLKRKIQFSSAILMAVDFCRDSVEITSESSGEVMFVNKSYETLTGYCMEEVIGHPAAESYAGSETSSTVSKESVGRSRGSSFRKGEKAWEGEGGLTQKSGSTLRTHTKFIPISNALLKVTHNVTISTALPPGDPSSDLLRNPYTKFNAVNGSPVPTESPSIDGKRGVGSISWAGVHHEDTPLWKVFRILSETSDHPETTEGVRHGLNLALRILLATPELYTSTEPTDSTDNNRVLSGLTLNPRRYSMTPTGTVALNSRTQTVAHQKPPAKVKAVLEKVMSWDFDIIHLEHLSQHTLLYVGMEVFDYFEICKFLRTDEKCLAQWFQLIEKHYRRSNTYHNSTHASDVMQCAAYFLKKLQERGDGWDISEVASVLIACAVHDVDHPGRTNPFLCNSGNDLAILYNDTAVLENHHAALTFKLTLNTKKANIFKNLDKATFRRMRSAIIDMVLATDMSKHVEHLTNFKTFVSSFDLENGGSVPNYASLPLDTKLTVRRTLVKAADISNPGRPQHLCQEWAKRISEEYFLQTEEEKKKGYPVVLPFFDRTTCNLPKTQIVFVDFFISELFQTWNKFLPVAAVMVHISSNYEFWKTQAEKVERATE